MTISLIAESMKNFSKKVSLNFNYKLVRKALTGNIANIYTNATPETPEITPEMEKFIYKLIIDKNW